MGELFVICVGMSVGGALAAMVLLIVPGLSMELRILGSTVGGLVGAMAGYALVWIMKKSLSNETAPLPPRHFARQVVGSDCAKCGERLLIISDGAVCPLCDAVFCVKCEPRVPCSACGEELVTAELADD